MQDYAINHIDGNRSRVLRFGLWGVGLGQEFEVSGLGFKVCSLGFGCVVWGFGLRVSGRPLPELIEIGASGRRCGNFGFRLRTSGRMYAERVLLSQQQQGQLPCSGLCGRWWDRVKQFMWRTASARLVG